MFSISPLSRATLKQSELVRLKHTLLRCSGCGLQAGKPSLPLRQQARKPGPCGEGMGMKLHKQTPVLAPELLPHCHRVQIRARKKEGEAKDLTTVTSVQDPLGQPGDSQLHPGGMNCPGSWGKQKSTRVTPMPKEAAGASGSVVGQRFSLCCNKILEKK